MLHTQWYDKIKDHSQSKLDKLNSEIIIYSDSNTNWEMVENVDTVEKIVARM